MFSDSTSLIWASASSSRRDSINRSFCRSSLELFRESLRFKPDGGANWLSIGEELFAVEISYYPLTEVIDLQRLDILPSSSTFDLEFRESFSR